MKILYISFFFPPFNTIGGLRAYGQVKALREAGCDVRVITSANQGFEKEENFDYEKLKKHFETYDVLGVAGASQIKIQEPALWHLMGGGFGSGNLHGAVAHLNNGKKSMTAFGPYPHQALIMDGVFLAISRKVFKKIRFDESCPAGFHFYDLAYTLDASLKGYKCGVVDAYITHASPGLQSFTKDWTEGQKWFLKKYDKYVGKTVQI